MYVDTHAHLNNDKLRDIDRVVSEFIKNNVSKVINMGCNAISSEQGKVLSEKYKEIYFGAGVHPSDVDCFSEKEFDKIIKLCSSKKCVAVGEIGLDYYWPGFDKEKQINVFVRQLELAKEMGLPVSIHCRDAMGDMLNILKQNKSKLVNGGVMHCYSGSVESLREVLDLNLYVSFSGTVTFKNANKLVDVAKSVPDDRILTETDCPYLSPHPYRGTVNEPKNIPIIVATLSQIRNIDNVKLADIVMKNAKTLFKKL